MQNGKKLFAILAGIFLLVSGTVFLISGIMQAAIYHLVNANIILGIQNDILLCLAGLFLLLKKPLPSAIMMSVAALFKLIAVLTVIRNLVAAHNGLSIAMQIVGFLALALFAAGLYGKRIYALIMCLSAAFLRAIPLIVSLRSLGRNGLTVFNFLAGLLLVAGMVMAGLYLFSFRRPAEQNTEPAYYSDPTVY